jgi:uncharacterized protein
MRTMWRPGRGRAAHAHSCRVGIAGVNACDPLASDVRIDPQTWESSLRSDISFVSGGLACRGWHYRPQSAAPAPAIVMSHGFSAVKEQGLAEFAEKFCAAGFHVLVFDYRHLGASDGADRGRIIPQEQHDDLRAAIGFASSIDGVDADRIGVWGTSYSGGHAMFVGALDPRVKVIVAQAPAISIARSLIQLAGIEGFKGYLALLAQDHATRNVGQPSGRIPVVGPAGQPSVLSTPDAFEWFTATGKGSAPSWINHTSLESVARMAEYTPTAFIDLARKPILMLAGEMDALIPIVQVQEAFARAQAPKRLEVFPGGHFDFYPGRRFHVEAAGVAAEWFKQHV